ncbi:response regulator transcription factor [Micromonospora sonneratiae]|uniref:Response regulator transcription factor n=1 Tax=Micromonospora sonneratiae TaxID=1184706 RepID=A0ABW3Y7Y0_9ACTN
MDKRMRVQIIAADPLARAEIDATVCGCPELTVVTEQPDVVLVVADAVTDAVLFLVSSLSRSGRRLLLAAGALRVPNVLSAVEAGAGGLLHREELYSGRLRQAVRAVADGEFTVPADLLGGLLARATGREAAQSSSQQQLTEREKAVLLMLADGHETEEIARSLAYSVRTVTGIVHNITHRWQLRNRAHAVAYALREGLI